MEARIISWDQLPREIAADPVATLAVDRVQWEQSGARFTSYEDEIGGESYVATGRVQCLDVGLDVGVLDHGEDSTYLLVQGAQPGNAEYGEKVLAAFVSGGVLKEEDILEQLPATRTESSEALGGLEQEVAALVFDVAELEERLARMNADDSVASSYAKLGGVQASGMSSGRAAVRAQARYRRFTKRPARFKQRPADRVEIVVDASERTLGEVAKQAADALRGDQSFPISERQPRSVVVINADKLRASASHRPSRQFRPANISSKAFERLLEERPEEAVRVAVKGIIRRNRMTRGMLTKLKVYGLDGQQSIGVHESLTSDHIRTRD